METNSNTSTGKKRLKEYLLEGLMIFVAVSMGFIAENVREKIDDTEKGNEYMFSMYQDLKADTSELNRIMKFKQNDIIFYDSLFYLLRDNRTKTNDIYYYLRILTRQNFFYRVDGTNKQLENAGGFRLVHNRTVVDSLNGYSRTYNELRDLQDLEQQTINIAKEKVFKIADGYVYDKMTESLHVKRLAESYPLLNFTCQDLNELHIQANALKRIRYSELNLMTNLQLKAKNLMLLLAEQYDIEGE
jgi:hypothetical protein